MIRFCVRAALTGLLALPACTVFRDSAEELKLQENSGFDISQVLKSIADRYVQQGEIKKAADLLARIVSLQPENRPLLVEHANLAARAGRWSEAAESLSLAVELDPTDHWGWYHLAPLLVETGQLDRYRTHCREMLDRFEEEGWLITGRVIQFCVFLPDTVDDWDRLGELSQQFSKQATNPNHRDGREATKGVCDYRAGKTGEAIVWLERSVDQLPESTKVRYLLFLAMAYQKEGRTEEALRRFQEADALLQPRFENLKTTPLGNSWHDWLAGWILRREAEALIHGNGRRRSQVPIGTAPRIAPKPQN